MRLVKRPVGPVFHTREAARADGVREGVGVDGAVGRAAGVVDGRKDEVVAGAEREERRGGRDCGR